jgi:hypothetical protein
MYQWSSWKVGMLSIPQAFFSFSELSNFCKSHGLIRSGGSLSAASSRSWTLASTRCSWFSSHKSCGVNWCFKQSAIYLLLCSGFIFWMIFNAHLHHVLYIIDADPLGQGQGQGYITTNSQSVSLSWRRAQSRTIDQSLLSP